MKTKLIIALLMISTITFAQAKKQQIKKTETSSKAIYLKIDGVKGETNDNNKSARYVKLEGVKGESNDNKKSTNYLEIDGIKGETNNGSTKRKIKIGGTEKPYARSMDENNNNELTNSKSNNPERVCNNDLVAERKNAQRTRGDVMLGDIDPSKKSTKFRKRVVVAKSNKQGDPDKN